MKLIQNRLNFGKTKDVTPFLKQVASAYYRRGAVEDTCFIFPNRRSEVFFMKYLADIVAERNSGGEKTSPLLVPGTCTVNDFIYRIYGTCQTDRIPLLLELYGVYSEIYGKAEPLDDFIFWGDIIIGDFNDVDKYLADPARLFANIADLKQIQDSYSYLSERQRKAIEAFVSHFSDRGGRLTVDLNSENPRVKERFLKIWNILYPLYTAFRARLVSKGMAYEGMVYRGVAERFRKESARDILAAVWPNASRYVFTGLNALNECEKTVMRGMQKDSIAEFCWDYAGEMISDRYNRASFFMKENIREFPQAVAFEDSLPVPDVRVISVPSSVGQAKQLPGIFSEIARLRTGGDLSKVGILNGGTGEKGTDCAVVLPDETLLMTVLNTVPHEIKDINVTMGYPITASAFYLYMQSVMEVQMNLRNKDGRLYFYYRPVHTLFSDNIFRLAAGEEGRKIIEEIRTAAQLYIPVEDLDRGGIFSAVFRPAVTDRSASGKEVSAAFISCLAGIVETTVPALRRSGQDGAELEFATEFYKTLISLGRMDLPVRPQTFMKILKQVLSPVSVPFKGEPLRGLQIMGPLETRAIDFDNLIILSANEGVFPRRNVSSSFIPPELRSGFGLPTYEYQDAVWAYYFYRMISRASNVWLLYDSRTEGLRSGEESRYIKQLQYHFSLPLKRYVVRAALSESVPAGDIPKTPEDIADIRKMEFSATAFQDYLACGAKFYYKYIRKLSPESEVSETLDAGIFGTVFHSVMQSVYSGRDVITRDFYLSLRKEGVKTLVREAIMKEMRTPEVSGRNLVVMDVIVHYVMKTLAADRELLERTGRQSFRILGLEKRYVMDVSGFRVKGVIDRIDTLSADGVRVVDYKTGQVKDTDVDIADDNAEAVAGAVFGKDNAKRPKIALQLYVYDRLVRQDPALAGRKIENCVYSVTGLFSGLPESYPVSGRFVAGMDAGLETLFSEMTDGNVPFRMTEDAGICGYCDFKTICGR